MGHVYRARDPQLRREVAIKVLSTAFRSDPDRQHRLDLEARAAASLNHPNVLAVHDFGVHEGIGFIVTELLEGETLRQKLAGGALPPRVAVDHAIQIAAGLAAGHDRGIIHRDIKPENLFVTADGRIKILDFGLAKTIGSGSSGDATETLTYDGAPLAPIVGTAPYMSPEQARGLRIDHRSDLFSLGSVLYEMLAGFAPFRRATAGETMSAVLHDDAPDIPGVSADVHRIVRHLLEKSAEARFQHARDVEFDLRALPPAALSSKPRIAHQRVSKRPAWIALIVIGILIAAAIGYFAGQQRTSTEQPAVVNRVERLTELRGLEESPSISPDGRSVAFTASVDGRRQIFVRLLAAGRLVQITNDAADHQSPRWSPDGNSLVYFSQGDPGEADGAIWSIPALGGSPRRVIDSISDADISRNGRLVFFRVTTGRVELVTSTLDGNDLRLLAASTPGYHRFPRWSPDGRSIAFQRGDGVRNDVFAISERGGEVRQITHDRNMMRGLAWLPDSRGIVFASSRGSTLPYLPPLALWRVAIDGGAPRRITPPDLWYEQPDIHSGGMLCAARLRMRFEIWRFPFDDGAANAGSAEQVTRQTGQVLTPSASPDGDHVAFLSDSGDHGNLWVTSMRTGELRQITFENDPRVTVGVPVWSPDGQSIAFVSSKGHTGYEFGVWLVDAEGRNPRNVAPRGLGVAWSPDGQWIYYVERAAGVLYKIRPAGGAPVAVRRDAARNVIGLHGKTLYYTIERVLLDGRPEVEIRAATPENGPSRTLVRIPATRVPSWQIVNPSLSPDGRWLAMPLTDGLTTNIWALSTESGAWRQVTDFADRATFIARRVSWSADGRSILAAVGEGDADIVRLDAVTAAR